jgi:hypothetical protein
MISPISLELAKIVLRAMELREGSYDEEASRLAVIKNDEEIAEFNKTNIDKIYYGGVDYKQFYKLTLEEACDQAAKEGDCIGVGRLIYLALDGWWNDTMYWAYHVTDPTAIVDPSTTNCQHGVEYSESEDKQFECELCTKNWDRIKGIIGS